MTRSFTDTYRDTNLNRTSFDGDDPSWAVAATQARVILTTDKTAEDSVPSHESELSDFFPVVPTSLNEAGLTESQVEALVTKFLLNVGASTGREIASQTALQFGFMERILQAMKLEQIVAIKSNAMLGDYVYELTSAGMERARLYSRQTTYFGAAPVPLNEYIQGVEAQSIRRQEINMETVRDAFVEFVVNHQLMRQLGEAMNMGRGMFLHGAPGNGKTSLAEAIIGAYSETIWIPRAIMVGGEIVRLYDPIHHQELPLKESDENFDYIDHRWVRIRRPTISVGGELELCDLNVSSNSTTGINEAPIQLKANCGILIIDDFGRNNFDPEQLLNRLIVPLEKQSDALHLSNGRTFRVPLDCLVVFATNLDPAALVDEAFLRRIPFSIEIANATEAEFREVFQKAARKLKIDYAPEHLDYLIGEHYHKHDKPMRFCHPRDILEQVKNSCEFQNRPLQINNESLDDAVRNLLSLRT